MGKITTLILPQGPKVRVDSHLFNGATVTPLYDPLLAKIIVHTTERQQSIAAMRRALDELIIEGINTNREELREILTSSDFLKGEYGTNLYNRLFSEVRHAAILDCPVCHSKMELYSLGKFAPNVTTTIV